MSTKKERRCYSVEFIVYCCILFTLPHGYKYMRSHKNIIMPHPRTIRSICSSFGMIPQLEHQDNTFLRYMAKKISELNEQQRYKTLMVDEIHLKPLFDYKGGNIAGIALNNAQAANSAFVFMVHSLMCKFKEVAHIIPVHKDNGEFLHNVLEDVIRGLEKIGYKVRCVVTDSNAVNRSAMVPFKYSASKAPQAVSKNSLANDFVFPHPSDPHRPLFFVIDPVHLLKSVHNNWLKQNDQRSWFPELEPSTARQRRMQYAYFKTVKDAYNLESEQLLRYGYTLSRKAVSPTDIEKQNVKPALQVFNESGPNALRVIGAKHNLKRHEETASLFDVIVRLVESCQRKDSFQRTETKG